MWREAHLTGEDEGCGHRLVDLLRDGDGEVEGHGGDAVDCLGGAEVGLVDDARGGCRWCGGLAGDEGLGRLRAGGDGGCVLYGDDVGPP